MPTPKSTAEAIKRWIGVCDSQHSACRKRCFSLKGDIIPTRLLDLGDSDSTTWNLWKTDTCVSYIALSHRWSRHTPALSRDNYHAYLRPQSGQVLPPILSGCHSCVPSDLSDTSGSTLYVSCRTTTEPNFGRKLCS